MTETQQFKHMAEQARQQAVRFRRLFKGLALINLLNATWMAAVGSVYIWQGPLFCRLMGIVLFILSGIGLRQARQTQARAQKSFQEFMKLRSRNLEIATMLESQ